MSEAIAANSDPTRSASNVVEVATHAIRHGAAAARAWESTSMFLPRLAYTASYSVSYGVVFSAALLARSVPSNNAAVRGLVEGARAAIDRVDQWRGGTNAALTDQAPAAC